MPVQRERERRRGVRWRKKDRCNRGVSDRVAGLADLIAE